MNKYLNIFTTVMLILVLLVFWMILAPTAKATTSTQAKWADRYDAHFFVRYDLSVQDENGNTHYDAHRYFPIGSVGEGYDRSDNESDYTSADGIVDANSAFIQDAESVIDNGEVNIYHQFGATKDTIKTHFAPVYNHIVNEPSKETMIASIERALGSEMATNYKDGKIDVLWYVIKQEKHIHVDGVLYWVDTGSAVEEPEEPVIEDGDKEFDEPEVKDNNTKEEVIKNANSPTKNSPTDRKVNHSPQTGDILPVMTLVIAVVIAGFGAAYVIRKKY